MKKASPPSENLTRCSSEAGKINPSERLPKCSVTQAFWRFERKIRTAKVVEKLSQDWAGYFWRDNSNEKLDFTRETRNLKVENTSYEPFSHKRIRLFLLAAAVSMFFFTNNLSFLEGLKPHKNELKKGQNLFPLGGSKWGDPSRSIVSWIFNSWLSFPTTKQKSNWILCPKPIWFPL